MLFLMNDALLDVDMGVLVPPTAAGRFRALSLSFVLQLGRELYAETPLLHRDAADRAKRLAALIASKAPRVNAALFEPPHAGCRPEEVGARLEKVEAEVIAGLQARQAEAPLSPVVADSEVWRRLAA